MNEKKTITNYYNKQQLYTITINPSDRHQYYNNQDRLSKVRNWLHEKLMETFDANNVKYDTRIEISEPHGNLINHQGPRVHLHGIFKFTSTLSIKNYLLFGQHKLNKEASIEIDICNDPILWAHYCDKQQNIIKPKTHLQNMELLKQYLLLKPKVEQSAKQSDKN
mgnify:CR=1 FL=1